MPWFLKPFFFFNTLTLLTLSHNILVKSIRLKCNLFHQVLRAAEEDRKEIIRLPLYSDAISENALAFTFYEKAIHNMA